MRRGHAGFSGWRSENPRHNKPRNGGNSYFRNSNNYGTLDTGHPHGNRHISKPNTFNHRFDNQERGHSNYSDTSRYKTHRYNTYHTDQDRPHHRNDRNNFPIFHRNKSHIDKPPNVYSNQDKHYQEPCQNKYYGTKNCKGDIDLRQPMQINQIPTWTNESRPFAQRHYETNQQNDVDVPKIPLPEYSGHRPPSSDHYGCNPTISAIDKSNSFSRSVDDTVDIVRKRLLNRNDSSNLDNFENRQNIESDNFKQSYSNVENNLQEQPTKKRIQRQRPNDQSSCAKIKNKIVDQLFKMDKERIHKLMNNPNSSTKFEYAISSLITESQISFNRHLRSVAEKSLCNPSNEFIQINDNTIYEDTFMKQMQCILDPQDTILLEDIKPIVMAELNNILQLDNIEHLYDDDNAYKQDNYNQFSDEKYDYQNISQINQVPQCRPENLQCNYTNMKDITEDTYNNHEQKSETEFYPLFQRRPKEIKNNLSTNIPITTESQFSNLRKNQKVPASNNDISQLKLFATDLEQFSDDDDTFTELDNQYHVAVDHNFIEDDEAIAHQVTNTKVEPEMELKSECAQEIKQESLDNQSTFRTSDKEHESNQNSAIFSVLNEHLDKNNRHDEANNMFQNNKSSNEEHSSTKSTISKPNSRKRSSNLRPPHRKEKRKKIDSSQLLESSKQILNKNIIINVNDCATKSKSEKCDNAPKSIFNLFFSKDKDDSITKEKKEFIGCDNSCLDKRTQKKHTLKTPDEKSKKSRTKHISTSSNQSTSPKEINTTGINQSSKLDDSKAMLKTIDMFTEKPRKLNIHQAHRNTALTPKNNVNRDNNENKSTNKIGLNKNITHVSVKNTIKKMHSKQCQTLESKTFTSKFCQTEKKKFAVKAIQTDISPPHKSVKSTDAFERMKEIDLEIQVLLQEKFKLYNTFESKDSYANTLQSLGMTVLNVSSYEGDNEETHEIILPEDVIVEEIANIPVEELEHIALETVAQEEDSEKKLKETRSRKVSMKSKSVQDKNSQKNKTPNISLLEQIITDERPLEDIISLDDLEMTPVKKTLHRNKKKQLSRKRVMSKSKNLKDDYVTYEIKECSVVLMREDFSVYSKEKLNNDIESNMSDFRNSECALSQNNIVEETVCNDMFDMLDVSEDIIIGDLSEDKGVYDKEVVEHVSIPINEEIILDNSQSSMEDMGPSAMEQSSVCKVYDFSADENLQRDSILVTGNADAVLAIECVANNFLAASLDGSVYYFSGDGQLLSTLRGSNLAVTCLTIVKEKYGTTVYTGSLDSRIRYYDLETGLEKGPECNVLSPIQTMDRAWDTIFVGTRTGFVLQFECKNNMLIPVSTVKFSEQSILALRAMKEGPRKVLLVAARSENVTVKDAQTGLLLRTLEGPKMTVYSLLYEDGKVYCGTSSHQIHVFDYTSGAHVGTHTGGKGAVCLRATGGLVLAGCYDGCVYVYREGEPTPRAQLRGPSLMLLSLAVVGTKIIAGYKDRSLYIWKIPHCILEDMIL